MKMDNKELITKLINFDEEDTSTGFNSVSKSETLEEYLSDNIALLYHYPDGKCNPGDEDEMRMDFVPVYNPRNRHLYLTRICEEWELVLNRTVCLTDGSRIGKLWFNADFIYSLVKRYNIIPDFSEWKRIYLIGTPENIGSVVKVSDFMTKYGGWTTKIDPATGNEVRDTKYEFPYLTVQTNDTQHHPFPEGISFEEFYSKIGALDVIWDIRGRGIEVVCVYPWHTHKAVRNIFNEFVETCGRTSGNG